MFNKHFSYLLDAASGATFLAGVFTRQDIAIFLGGLASITAFINHLQQIYDRKQAKKQKPKK